jgi:AraC-like DNA-binding protein
MQFFFSVYSSVLLIFFVHGLVYAILLWQKSWLNDTPADKWLSLFLFLSVLYISPWMLGFAGWYDNQPYRDILFYTPFQQLFLIGPVIFFYVQSLLNPSFRFGRKHWPHLIPGVLYVLYCLMMVVADKWVVGDYFFLADQQDRDFDTWYQLAGYCSMIIYFVASISYYNRYKQLMPSVVSYAGTVVFSWVRNFLLAFLVILLLKTLFFLVSLMINVGYWDEWWYFLAFSVCFYYIAITGYSNSTKTKIPFQAQVFTKKPAVLLWDNNAGQSARIEEAEPVETGKAGNETLGDAAFIAEWKHKILDKVVGMKLFEEPELSLSDLANSLQTNPSVLSKAVNKSFGLNFNDFINYYRVMAVQEKLKGGSHKKQTLLGIAYDAGFNSKATFNRAFKKVTGVSPKEWLEKENLS